MNELELLQDSRLTQIRIARVEGKRPKVQVLEGTLVVTSKFGLSSKDSEPWKRMASLIFEVKGLPQNADDTADPAFTVLIEVRGLIKFPEKAPLTLLDAQERLRSILCQPLYVYACKKAEELLADMGVRNLRLDPDLRTVGDAPQEGQETDSNSGIAEDEPRARRGALRKPGVVAPRRPKSASSKAKPASKSVRARSRSKGDV
jgi:hypothetical protein